MASQLDIIKTNYINPLYEEIKYLFPIINNFFTTNDFTDLSNKIKYDHCGVVEDMTTYDYDVYEDRSFKVKINLTFIFGLVSKCSYLTIVIVKDDSDYCKFYSVEKCVYNFDRSNQICFSTKHFPTNHPLFMVPDSLLVFSNSGDDIAILRLTNPNKRNFIYHRLDGPAVLRNSFLKKPQNIYYIDGQNISRAEFDKHPTVLARKNNLELFE